MKEDVSEGSGETENACFRQGEGESTTNGASNLESSGSGQQEGSVKQTAKIEGDGPTILLERAESFTYNDHRGREAEASPPKFEDPTFEFELPEQSFHVHAISEALRASLIDDLKKNRVLILSALREKAALAAAYSLLTEEDLQPLAKRALDPAREDLAERTDISIYLFTRTEMTKRERVITLVEINARCDFLDSILGARDLYAGSITATLKKQSSYLIVTTESSLVPLSVSHSESEQVFRFRHISYLSYLLGKNFIDERRRFDIEAFLKSDRMRRIFCQEEDLFLAVESILASGANHLEEFIRDLEVAPIGELPEKWLQRLRPSGYGGGIAENSDAHRVAAYVGVFFPGLAPSDFDRLTTALLLDETRTIEHERRVVAADGAAHSVREVIEESWAKEWRKNSDRILRECRLKPSISSNGRWSIDFSEPYLRSELKAYLEQSCSLFLLRMAERLQSADLLFARVISPTLLKGVIRLLVESAIADPYRFGSTWLVDLVISFRTGAEEITLPRGLPVARLSEALARLAIADAAFRRHFYSRLALLIREMLETDKLRPMVEAFLDTLVLLRGEDTLCQLVVDLVFELARRLRFAPHFDALLWIRRLLDRSTAKMRQQIAVRLLGLATESGARIYEFLSVVHSWLPTDGWELARLSNSSRLALEFPYVLSLRIARGLHEDRFGEWPSVHLLFAPLTNDATETSGRIQMLVGWLFHPSGAGIFPSDSEDSTITPEISRLGVVADLLEHWSCVLGGFAENKQPEGNTLLMLILSEVTRITGPREHSWLQRFWRRQQEDYSSKLGRLTREERRVRLDLVERRERLEDLRKCFAQPINSSVERVG